MNKQLINILAQTIVKYADKYCPLLASLIQQSKGRELALLVLNRALYVQGEGKERAYNSQIKLVAFTLYSALRDHCNLDGLLHGKVVPLQKILGGAGQQVRTHIII